MHKFNDKNLATYRYNKSRTLGHIQHNCKLHDSKSKNLCAKFPNFKFRTEMKKYAFQKHATSSELNWVSD